MDDIIDDTDSSVMQLPKLLNESLSANPEAFRKKLFDATWYIMSIS